MTRKKTHIASPKGADLLFKKNQPDGRPTLEQMLARFDPALHGGEFMPGAPVGKEASAEGLERPKRHPRV